MRFCCLLSCKNNTGHKGRTVFEQEQEHLTNSGVLVGGGHPNFAKKSSENERANENLSCGFPSIPGIAPGVAQRIVAFVLLKSWDAIPRMEFRIPRMEFRIPRALREHPGTLRELREWPFTPRAFFPEIGGGPQASEG